MRTLIELYGGIRVGRALSACGYPNGAPPEGTAEYTACLDKITAWLEGK